LPFDLLELPVRRVPQVFAFLKQLPYLIPPLRFQTLTPVSEILHVFNNLRLVELLKVVVVPDQEVKTDLVYVLVLVLALDLALVLAQVAGLALALTQALILRSVLRPYRLLPFEGATDAREK